MDMYACGKLNGHNDLVSRIRKTCDTHNVSFLNRIYVCLLCLHDMIVYSWGKFKWIQWSSQGGHGGHGPPKLLVNVFSPINLSCYVLLVCK